jgi:hypothetical protein
VSNERLTPTDSAEGEQDGTVMDFERKSIDLEVSHITLPTAPISINGVEYRLEINEAYLASLVNQAKQAIPDKGPIVSTRRPNVGFSISFDPDLPTNMRTNDGVRPGEAVTYHPDAELIDIRIPRHVGDMPSGSWLVNNYAHALNELVKFGLCAYIAYNSTYPHLYNLFAGLTKVNTALGGMVGTASTEGGLSLENLGPLAGRGAIGAAIGALATGAAYGIRLFTRPPENLRENRAYAKASNILRTMSIMNNWDSRTPFYLVGVESDPTLHETDAPVLAPKLEPDAITEDIEHAHLGSTVPAETS